MSKKDLIKRYREQMAKSSEKAPEGLWDNIARTLDDKLINQYQQQLDQNRLEAPEGIWDNIERNLDNEIISSYQTKLTESHSTAPEGIWDNIERSLDSDVINKYHDQLEIKSEKAPDDIWDKIEQKLDVDEVWHRVTTVLDTNKNRTRFWAYAARAAAIVGVIITLGIGGWFTIERLRQPQLATRETNENLPQQNNEIANITDEDEFIPPDIAPLDYSPVLAMTDLQAANQIDAVADEQVLLGRVESFNRLKSRPTTLAQAHTQQLHSVFAHKHANFEMNILYDDQIADQRRIAHLAEEPVNYPALSLGFSAGIKNTWLFSNETFLGLAGYNGHRTELNFVPDFSLTMRYQLRPQWEIEAGVSFSSNIGQTYYQYIHGRFSRKDISLNYLHGEILANYLSRRSWVLLQNSVRLNTTVGFYFAGLKNAFESIEGERFDVSNNYQNIDFGLILGQNVDFELPGNLTFSPGIRLTWGLPNIHQRMPDLPEFMWKTLHRSLEFRLAVFYRIPFGN